MNWSVIRTARKPHRCACGNSICPGDLYVDHRCTPNHDVVGNSTWWRARECSDCARRYGRMEADS